MRIMVGALAFVLAGAASLAVADPSDPAKPEAAAASTTSAPAAAPAAATSKPALDPDEKRLIAAGYHPRIRNGVKVYCRVDEELGSRLGAKEHCGTVEDLKASMQAAHEDMESVRRDSLRVVPVGK
jgi:hypothetical protein